MNRTLITLLILILGFFGLTFLYLKSNTNKQAQKNNTVSIKNNNTEKITVIAQNLEVPWAITFLPNNDLLVTERKGEIKKIEKNKNVETIANIDEVEEIGEGGLLGITVHPNFEANNYLYVYYTYGAEGNQTLNRVVRYIYKDKNLSDRKVIVDRIPGASNHNGGRIKFGPDGFLYIATGDAQEPSLSQNTNSLAGKILRVTDTGEKVNDNPFNNLVYSYGHRNPQGLAWINNKLWATEHGSSANDELNEIEKGKNYGWPTIQGNEERSNMQTPIVNSGSETWAPSGLAFHNGFFYFAGLRGNALFSFDSNNRQNGAREHFKDEFGRLREIVVGPDGFFYITTSNRDGRGTVNTDDDKILRVNPNAL